MKLIFSIVLLVLSLGSSGQERTDSAQKKKSDSIPKIDSVYTYPDTITYKIPKESLPLFREVLQNGPGNLTINEYKAFIALIEEETKSQMKKIKNPKK